MFSSKVKIFSGVGVGGWGVKVSVLHEICPIANAGSLKKALTAETKAWKKLICRYLKEKYKKKKIETTILIKKYHAQLCNPVADLEGARHAMGTLTKLRNAEIQIDMTLVSIKVGPEKGFCFSNCNTYIVWKLEKLFLIIIPVPLDFFSLFPKYFTGCLWNFDQKWSRGDQNRSWGGLQSQEFLHRTSV